MISHLVKTGDMAKRSEHNAVQSANKGSVKDTEASPQIITNLGILASNDDILLTTKNCDTLRHLGSCNSCLRAPLCNIHVE